MNAMPRKMQLRPTDSKGHITNGSAGLPRNRRAQEKKRAVGRHGNCDGLTSKEEEAQDDERAQQEEKP
jgi:hypothetical protein